MNSSLLESLLNYIADQRRHLSIKEVNALSDAADVIYKNARRQAGIFNLSLDEMDALRVKRNKIVAIKAYRERTGVSLIESKKAVESWMQDNLGFKYFN